MLSDEHPSEGPAEPRASGADGKFAPFSAYMQELGACAVGGRAWRASIKSWMTTALLPLERRRARRLSASGAPLRLHPGCADNYVPGWLSVDLARPGCRVDLRWLRRPVPFPSDSVRAIFTEHMLEHFSIGEAFSFVRNCGRLLSRGAVLRIDAPDLERYIRSYQGLHPLIEEVRPGRPTAALAFCEVFYLYGHRSMYDLETLQALCLETGFAQVERSSSGEGRIQLSPDTPGRPAELHIEAVA